MSPDSLFTISNSVAMIGWLLLILVPDWKYTKGVVQGGLISILLGFLYLYLIVFYFGNADGGFDSLENVMLLFGNKHAVLAGWVHYLAFDLWVGSWEAGDAVKRGISRWLVLPCLLLTFMFGPVGLLLYLFIRSIHTKKIFTHDNFRSAG